MMNKYTCDKCGKAFSQKSHYNQHIIRKNPCESQPDKIKFLINKAVEEKLLELKKLIPYDLPLTTTKPITPEQSQMNFSNLSKSELIEKCKELGITRCVSKTKPQLIELINSKQSILEMKEEKPILNDSVTNVIVRINETSDFSKLKKQELLEKCKELGITRCVSKTKPQLIELLNSKQNSVSSEISNTVKSQKTTPTQISEDYTNKRENNKTIYTFIEVCAGGGGLSAGLIKAGFTPLLLNDNNNDCCKTLKRNHPEANVVCGSMDKIDYSQYVGKVDLLTGGVPCQSFSQAGLRKGLDDPRGDLMMKFIEILNLIQPKIFMIENVKGLLTHDNGKTIQTIIETLNNNNLYDISYRCLDASKYEVPQKRERVFIVGVLKSLNRSYEFPVESPIKKVLKDVLYNVPLSNGAKYSEEKINLFKIIPQGGCWVNLPENLQREYLGNSYESGGGKRGILYRLSMEKPSLTLLCSPSQKQTERCHPLEERPLNVREYARIQTFEDSYEFIGSLNSQYKQIGNAVPVELAKRMGGSLLHIL